MLREEIIKGLKIATRKISGCSDVGGWLDNDEALARKSCEEAIKLLEQKPILDKIRAEIDTARFIDKDTKLCKNANASGLEVAMQIINKYIAELKGE